MLLENLFLGVKTLFINGAMDKQINNICCDSRQAQIGDVFVCLQGGKYNGNDFVLEAIENGASCIVTQDKIFKSYDDITTIRVADTRYVLALLAKNFYQNPTQNMKVISVVGTNGKSTTAYLINEILKINKFKTGLIGTIKYEINDISSNSVLTTPDPLTLYELLHKMKLNGVEVVIMEVSAHAIYYSKVAGIVSDMTIFTNFSQDHLDFFGTMEKYKKTKMSFFNKHNTKFAILNVDDDCGRELTKQIQIPFLTYGIDNPANAFAMDIEPSKNIGFLFNMCDDICKIESNLQGRFNIYNIICATIACKKIGLNLSAIADAIKTIKAVPGRFNTLNYCGVNYVVDFAHTPDGLEKLLQEIKKLKPKHLITVFGCGGNRDAKKRVIMGEIAEKFSDYIIVTKDNSRGETPIKIIEEIVLGIKNKSIVKICEKREDAINYAINIAKTGDYVVIAGKGAETSIIENGKEIPFNDMECLKALLQDEGVKNCAL